MTKEQAAVWLKKFEARLKEPRIAGTDMGDWYLIRINNLKRMLYGDEAEAPEAQV
jgi:hypothetical protein